MTTPRSRRNPEIWAAETLRSHGAGAAAPIDVAALAAREGAEVVTAPLEDGLSGILIREKNRRIIAVAEGHAEVRRRYTIAHELGHLLMHPGRPYLAESDQIIRIDKRGGSTPGFADQREEREANQFAAALLMPPELVLTRWLELDGTASTHNLNAMAQHFGVSSLAMKYRLINLGLFSPHNTDEA